MQPLEAVACVSSATGSPPEAHLVTLLERSRARNDELEVTGVLLQEPFWRTCVGFR